VRICDLHPGRIPVIAWLAIRHRACYPGAMHESACRKAIIDYIRAQAKPPDKFSHQARLYHLATRLAEGRAYDDDVLFAAAWMHDLGVFVGHRPADPAALATWDHIAYAIRQVPLVLKQLGFPEDKIEAVLEAIRTHLPSARPTTFEGTLLRDADLLEQLGAIAVLRTVSKIGRDTRFERYSDALRVLKRNLGQLPSQLELPAARRLAEPRVKALKAFLEAAEAEAEGNEL
jgi:uncharacterized protein